MHRGCVILVTGTLIIASERQIKYSSPRRTTRTRRVPRDLDLGLTSGANIRIFAIQRFEYLRLKSPIRLDESMESYDSTSNIRIFEFHRVEMPFTDYSNTLNETLCACRNHCHVVLKLNLLPPTKIHTHPKLYFPEVELGLHLDGNSVP